MLKKFQSVPLSPTRAAHELWHQRNRINKEIQGENELKETSRNLKEKKQTNYCRMFFHLKPV